jgi:hypothetical protein
MTMRRVRWLAITSSMVGAVAWAGYFDGPQAVANLAVAYAWINLGLALFLTVVVAAVYALINLPGGQQSERIDESRDSLLAKIGTMQVSIPVWLDKVCDGLIALLLIGAGWWATSVVWVLGMAVGFRAIRKTLALRKLHERRLEESLGVKL